MPRFYVPDPHIEDELIRIKGPEARHIRRVLRLQKGDEVVVFDGSGREYEGTIVEEGVTSVSVKIEKIRDSGKGPVLEVTLAQSLLKGEKMDYLIQKATELGVAEVVPFFSMRSIPLLERSKKVEKSRRWMRIAIEASKQCGRKVIPEVRAPLSYSHMLSIPSSESLRLILLEKGGKGLREMLKESKSKERVFFIVGPEGGLSQGEIEEAERTGFVPVTLGSRVMRAETASLCVLSILQYEWGDIE